MTMLGHISGRWHRKNWKWIRHRSSPTSSIFTDLSPTDYHMFKHLDNFLRDKKFTDQRAVEKAFFDFINAQTPEKQINRRNRIEWESKSWLIVGRSVLIVMEIISFSYVSFYFRKITLILTIKKRHLFRNNLIYSRNERIRFDWKRLFVKLVNLEKPWRIIQDFLIWHRDFTVVSFWSLVRKVVNLIQALIRRNCLVNFVF